MKTAIDLARYAHEKEMRTFCHNKGLRMVFEEKHQPRTDGRAVYVGKPDPRWTEDEVVEWKYSIYHELGHNVDRMRDCFEMAKEKNLDMSSFLGVSCNLVDDYRQEHYKYDEYYGRQKIMSKGRQLAQKGIINNANFWNSDDERMKALNVMSVWDAWMRERWMPDTVGQANQMEQLLDDKQRAQLEVLKNGDYTDVINNTPTAWEEYDLVKRILDEVFEIDSDKEEQEATQQQQGDGEDGDGQGEQGKGKSKPGEGDGDEEAAAHGDGTVRYDDILAHKHGEAEVEEGTSYSSLHIEYDEYTEQGFSPDSEDRMRIINYRTDGIRGENSYYANEILSSMNDSALSKQVRRLLQVMSQSFNQHGQKSGKVSKRSVYRATVKGNDGYAQRIFHKKLVNNVLDTSVSVLVDGSGSMKGDKFICAAQAAIMLNNAICKIGVPVEVIGFSETGTRATHGIFKAFDESVNSDTMASRFADFAGHYMQVNSDGESVLWATNRLLKQKSKKKVLIVLSDGCPNSHKGDAYRFTRDVVKTIEESKAIDVYGIGIMDDNVRRIYTNNQVIDDPQQIESAIFSFIKNRVIKSN